MSTHTRTRVTHASERGWDVVDLTNELATVRVVPGKGGDILRFRVGDDRTDVLWRAPWGLRHRGAAQTPGASSADTLIEWYPGGWQTMLPNGGDEVAVHGTTWGMHGEAWTAPFEVIGSDGLLGLATRLVRSPLEIVRWITLEGSCLRVEEEVRNVGRVPVDAVWGHHPAFAPGFVAGGRIELAAATVVVDDLRDTPAGDLRIGARAPWPLVPGRSSEEVDLSLIPRLEGPPVERMAYLTDLAEGRVTIHSARHPWRASLRWDLATFPHAWLWTEFHGTPDFPWFQAVDVLAIEPCTGFPAQGLDAIARTTGPWTLAAGQTRRAIVELQLDAVG